MNWNNFVALGLWLRRKLSALMVKRKIAEDRIRSSGYSEEGLALEWATQREDSVQKAPSKSVRDISPHVTNALFLCC